MEGLPPAKAERIAAMRRELAELQRQLIEAQQRIATELQGRAEDAERLETTEARLHEYEAKVHEGAAREAALASELAKLNTQLSAIGATTEELRRQVASRDTQLEEARQQHRDAAAQPEAQTVSLADTKAQLETRAADLAARTTERDSEQAAKARLEQELADERKKHGESAGQLESHVASLRDANALVATRDAELMAIAKERDAVNAELATSRAKLRDLANQFLRVGNEMLEHAGEAQPGAAATGSGPIATLKAAEASKPPPIPPPRTGARSVPPPPRVAVLEVTEEGRSKSGFALALFAGVILGCAATFAFVGLRGSSSDPGDRRDTSASPSPPAASEHAAAAVEPAVAVEQANDLASTEQLKAESHADDSRADDSHAAVPIATATDGTIVLPREAAEHRLFVDGHVVPVKNSRAVVRCGSHEIRIGSHGTAQTVDVACGIETEVAMDPHDH
jgi:hypothetical protein